MDDMILAHQILEHLCMILENEFYTEAIVI